MPSSPFSDYESNKRIITGSKLMLWGLAILLTFPIFTDNLSAQNGSLLQQTSSCGSNPNTVDIAVRPSDATVWSIDATSGKICVYDTSGTLALTNMIDHPVGAAQAPLFQPQCAGITYSASTDSFWILNSTGLELIQMDPLGNPIGAPISLNFSGTPSGLTINPLNGRLWSLNRQENSAVEIDPVSGNILSTLPLPGDVVRFGSGLKIRLDNGNPILDYTYGNIFDSTVAETRSVDLATGELLCHYVNLESIPQEETLLGIANGLGSDSIYGLTSSNIYEIQSTQSILLPPADLLCLADGEGSVSLSWRNCGPGINNIYSTIRITRNGAIIDTISGAATSWSDNAAPNEAGILYQVQGVLASNVSTSSCHVNNSPGGLSLFLSIPNFYPRDLAYDTTMDDLYVTDSFSGELRVFSSDLVLKRVIDTGLTNLRGVGYNSVLDVLLVSRVGSSLMTFVDPLTGSVLSSFPSGSNNISSISFDASTNDWLLFSSPSGSNSEILRMEAEDGLEGNPLGAISPPQTSGLVMSTGIATLADGSFLVGINNGGVPTSLSQLTSFGFPLNFIMPMAAIGQSLENLSTPWTGIELIGNTIVVAGYGTNTLYKLLVVSDGPDFLRGDSDSNNLVNLADAIFTAMWLYSSGSTPTCMDAADANDDGTLDISDPIYTLLYLFGGSAAPPLPFPQPGEDPSFIDNLGC